MKHIHVLAITIILSLTACNKPPVERVIYVPVHDTVSVEDITRIIELEHK